MRHMFVSSYRDVLVNYKDKWEYAEQQITIAGFLPKMATVLIQPVLMR